MTWDPGLYLEFDDERTRPAIDLMSRIPVKDPGVVVDLGCGTGHLTRMLAEHWPSARLVGIDSSTAMLERTVPHPRIDYRVCDIVDWSPSEPVDVIFSNAALHWVGGHDLLFERLLESLSPAGALAVQMPDNFAEATHEAIRIVARSAPFARKVAHLAPGFPVSPPAAYRRFLSSAARIDQWETIYHQVLSGEDPVLRWTKGTVMRPLLDALDRTERRLFLDRVGALYRQAYPPEANGSTILPFRRRFIVAVRA